MTMKAVPDCELLMGKLDRLLADELDHEEAERVRDHLADCEECGARAREKDPSLIFLALRGQSQSEFFWASMWRDLQEALPQRPPRRRHGILPAAAVVAAVATVGLLTWLQGGAGIVSAPGEHMARTAEPPAPAASVTRGPDPVPAHNLPPVTPRDTDSRVLMIDTNVAVVYNPKIDL